MAYYEIHQTQIFSSLFFILFLISLFFNASSERIINADLNPNCNIKECNDVSFVHIVSDEINSTTYHYLSLFATGFKPSLFLLETDRDTNLTIDWKAFFQHSNKQYINFKNGVIHNAFGLEISEMFLTNMTGHYFQSIPINNLKWKTSLNKGNKSILVDLSADKDATIGGFSFRISASSQPGRDIEIPHLFYTNSGISVQFLMENITLKFNTTDAIQVRANITMILESKGEKPEEPSQIEKFISIDDEYTPGIFYSYVYKMSLMENKAKESDSSPRSSFMAWKPIAYYDRSKTTSKSLNVINPSIIEDVKIHPSSLLLGYFNSKPYYGTKLSQFKFNSADDVEFEFKNTTAIEFTFTLSLYPIMDTTFSNALITILWILGILGAILVFSLVFLISFVAWSSIMVILRRRPLFRNYSNVSEIS